MTKRMLIDATHPEETRVAVVAGNKLEEYDYETIVRKQLKGNIYLVKVSRVEPSLQAAFVDFGGNRHGFLPFPEVHPDYYRIPIADREALLAEERAWAAAQAAREDAEDAAELAAAGESVDDEELNMPAEPRETADAEVSLAESIQPIQLFDSEDDTIETLLPADETAGEESAGEGADGISEHAARQNTSEEDQLFEGHAAAAAGSEPASAGDTEEEAAHDHDQDHDHDAPVFRPSIKRRYKIQEVVKRNQIMLIQISKEERGNKGAAVTTYISLPGRYCVLMPNSSRGGGVSRKVSNAKDRQRLKKILRSLNVPEGMSVILRTAGVSRALEEIRRDLDYLLRLWDQIRELTLKSTAPALIYEEGNLIKRAIRDLYKRDISEIWVAGAEGHRNAQDFMRTLMPSHVERVHVYQEENIPLFSRYQVETQIDAIHSPTVHLKSGGYIVINPTEAMISIDVNSGRATKGRHIEETALKTNIEAAEEIARQLRLRDLGGLVVIDFIDMEDKRNNRIVERRVREAMQTDRARIQLGRISPFGLLELSRQRLNPSLVETSFETCAHCAGSGLVRTTETSTVMVLRAIEEEGLRHRAAEIKVGVPTEIALYIFNHKRDMLSAIEQRHGLRVFVHADDSLIKPNYTIDIQRAAGSGDVRPSRPAPVQTVDMSDVPDIVVDDNAPFPSDDADDVGIETVDDAGDGQPRERRHGGRRGRDRGGDRNGDRHGDRDRDQQGRRRGNRGGRRRGGRRHGRDRDQQPAGAPAEGSAVNTGGGTGAQPTVVIPIEAPATSRTETARSEPAVARESSPPPVGTFVDTDAATADGQSRKGWWKRLTD